MRIPHQLPTIHLFPYCSLLIVISRSPLPVSQCLFGLSARQCIISLYTKGMHVWPVYSGPYLTAILTILCMHLHQPSHTTTLTHHQPSHTTTPTHHQPSHTTTPTHHTHTHQPPQSNSTTLSPTPTPLPTGTTPPPTGTTPLPTGTTPPPAVLPPEVIAGIAVGGTAVLALVLCCCVCLCCCCVRRKRRKVHRKHL